MSPLTLIISIALAGAAGTLSRFGLGLLVSGVAKASYPAAVVSFPWAIMIANVAGSFGFGLIFALTHSFGVLPREYTTILLVGFFGAFTTFSTFSYDTVRLLADGRYVLASANAFGQLFLGLVAVVAGMAVGAGLARLLGATATGGTA